MSLVGPSAFFSPARTNAYGPHAGYYKEFCCGKCRRDHTGVITHIGFMILILLVLFA